ncbi:MAG: TolB family protein [Candidatus Xenobia bacterium]
MRPMDVYRSSGLQLAWARDHTRCCLVRPIQQGSQLCVGAEEASAVPILELDADILHPTFSQDGDAVYFSLEGTFRGVGRLDLTSGEWTRLTSERDWAPLVVDHAHLIAWRANHEGRGALILLNTNSGAVQSLSQRAGFYLPLRWDPVTRSVTFIEIEPHSQGVELSSHEMSVHLQPQPTMLCDHAAPVSQ